MQGRFSRRSEALELAFNKAEPKFFLYAVSIARRHNVLPSELDDIAIIATSQFFVRVKTIWLDAGAYEEPQAFLVQHLGLLTTIAAARAIDQFRRPRTESVDTPINGGSGETFGDLLPDRSTNIEKAVTDYDLLADFFTFVKKHCSETDHRELVLRTLEEGEGFSRRDTANRAGISYDRLKRLERRRDRLRDGFLAEQARVL